MKRFSFNTLAVLLGVLMLTFVTSCKDNGDDPEPVSNIPVLNEDFSFVVNANDVVFSTTLTGSVWFTDVTAATDYNAVDGTVSVNLPLAGSYPFTCSILLDGVTYTSEQFSVTIESDDLSFLESGIWNALTGGVDGGKVWILDIEKKYFHAIADYYGDEDAGATGKDVWGPWGGGYVSNYDLGGEISFNGVDKTVTLVYNGETKNGTFTFDVYDRPASADYVNYGTGATTFDLWADGFGEFSPYKYLTLSEQMGTMHLSEGLHFPLDSARFYNDAVKGSNTVNPSQFLDEDLRNCDIVHLSDSAMVVRVKRSFEGDDPNKCWMLYNFIVKGYEYTDDFVAPDRPATEGNLENGTYKLAEIPGYYYSWFDLSIGDTWETLDAYKLNMGEWWCLGNPAETMTDGALNEVGIARWDSAYKAYTAQTIVVDGNNITVNYKGINVWGDNPTEIIENTVTTTFTTSGGVITFADPISVYCPNAGLDNKTELYILPGVFTTGIAIGADDINVDDRTYNTRLQNWILQ